MSRSGRTNQVLFFARNALSSAESSREEGNIQTQRQFEEAALFHLYTALSAFCAEVVAQYQMPPMRDVLELTSRQDLPAELGELRLQLASSGSWLADLVQAYQRLLLQGLTEQNNGVVGQQGLITSQSDYLALFRNWLIELENLINRQREHYLEC